MSLEEFSLQIYDDHLRSKGLSPASRKAHLSTIRTWLRNLIDEGKFKEEIIRLVRRIVEVSDALGIESFALPILAGGTAAKKLRAEGLASDQDIIQFILMALFEALAKHQNSIKSVFLVVFDNRHLTDGLLAKL